MFVEGDIILATLKDKLLRAQAFMEKEEDYHQREVPYHRQSLMGVKLQQGLQSSGNLKSFLTVYQCTGREELLVLSYLSGQGLKTFFQNDKKETEQ